MRVLPVLGGLLLAGLPVYAQKTVTTRVTVTNTETITRKTTTKQTVTVPITTTKLTTTTVTSTKTKTVPPTVTTTVTVSPTQASCAATPTVPADALCSDMRLVPTGTGDQYFDGFKLTGDGRIKEPYTLGFASTGDHPAGHFYLDASGILVATGIGPSCVTWRDEPATVLFAPYGTECPVTYGQVRCQIAAASNGVDKELRCTTTGQGQSVWQYGVDISENVGPTVNLGTAIESRNTAMQMLVFTDCPATA